jgi:hypothetical protein
MKSEAKLKISYEEQKIRFEANQRKKIANIDNNIQILNDKITSLTKQREQLLQNKQKVSEGGFPTFEDYVAKSRNQASLSKKEVSEVTY